MRAVSATQRRHRHGCPTSRSGHQVTAATVADQAHIQHSLFDEPKPEQPQAPVPPRPPREQADYAPSGVAARINANMEALVTILLLQAEQREATEQERQVLQRWSGWGATPELFDPAKPKWQPVRDKLRQILGARGYDAARTSTLNAHYTDVALADTIWAGVAQFGFTGGTVLEPGCGSGNFLGGAPATAQMTGVELDPTTAVIAQWLNLDAEVQTGTFAGFRAPPRPFDLAIGNVPFGKIYLTDREYNPDGFAIHNHFIIRALHLTRPGGLVAMITSKYTMDAETAAHREVIADLADLVTAIRLPSTAHQRAAGTKVVSDLLILRRREPGRMPAPVRWLKTRTVHLDGYDIPVNEYFLDNPGQVLGTLGGRSGQFRGELEVTLKGRSLPGQLARALAEAAARAAADGLTWTAPGEMAAAPSAGERTSDQDGHISADPLGTFHIARHGYLQQYVVAASQARELRALLQLRDIALQLLDAQADTTEDSPAITVLRSQLNRAYDTYAAKYGTINRFTIQTTSRINPDTKLPAIRRIRPKQGGLRNDPHSALVYALEVFDPISQTAAKARIFTERVITKRVPPSSAENAADALAICMDMHGEPRLPVIARLLDVTQEDAGRELTGLVYSDPVTRELIHKAEYLSGEVRTKLAIAERAALDEPAFRPNVEALRAALPVDLLPTDITARLGASWIDAVYVQQFAAQILEDRTVNIEHPGGQIWKVTGRRDSVHACSTWGTSRASAIDMIESLLCQRPIQVRDRQFDGSYLVNVAETLAAVDKASEIAERFGEWVWEQPDRAEKLARTYNDMFNSTVLRSYDFGDDETPMSLPGLTTAGGWKPRRHQYAAVARIINEPAVGLFHEVGAGKTAEMIIGMMELRRLGLVRKPVVVVPNHMLEQFSRDWLQLYPQAKVLVAFGEDLVGQGRRRFVARCATGDWDGIIISRSAFELIPMSADSQRDYMEREMEIFKRWKKIAETHAKDTVKQIERILLNKQERMERKLDKLKDPGLCFEETGIDYLCCDEAHYYKNLHVDSAIPGAGKPGAARAADIEMKIMYLRQRNGKRVVTFATATPVANSIAEMYVIQRYLRPDLLEARGIDVFDTWAATFGISVTEIEMAPEGGANFRSKTRFSKFCNVPELLRMFAVFGDVKTAEDLNLPAPALAQRESDEQRLPETVVVPPYNALREYIRWLGQRAEEIRQHNVEPEIDNMLKICTGGRKATLNMRLVETEAYQDGLPPNDWDWRLAQHLENFEPSSEEEALAAAGKVGAAADRIHKIWLANRDHQYPVDPGNPDGPMSPVSGSLQLMFCDMATPGKDRIWDAYTALRAELAARGMDPATIRFMHNAKTDRDKAELFAACRAGSVTVLMGSTEKMGVGVNVQDRLIALHHLDAPWRPADVHQRDGRGIRQGNLNPEVMIFRYVVEASFDAYMWQTLERKARFIAQVMRGRLDTREIEDVGDNTLSFAEVKALATGNPLLMEHAQATTELARLQRAARAHDRNLSGLQSAVTAMNGKVNWFHSRIEDIERAIAIRLPTRGDLFSMTLEGVDYTKRADAGAHLKRLIIDELMTMNSHDIRTFRPGTFAGFQIFGKIARFMGTVTITIELDGAPSATLELRPKEVHDADPAGLIARMEHRAERMETAVEDARAEIERLTRETERARAGLAGTFAKAAELEAARARVGEINTQIADLAKTQAAEQAAGDKARDDAARATRAAARAVDMAAAQPVPAAA